MGIHLDKKEEDFKNLLQKHGWIIEHVVLKYASKDSLYYNDLFQEIEACLWKEFKNRTEDKSNEKGWIYRVSRNCAENFRILYLDKLNYENYDVLTENEIIDKSVYEKVDTLLQLIEQLDPIDQRIVTLYLDELSYEQIGDRTGMTESAVGTRMSRIFKKLKEMYYDL